VLLASGSTYNGLGNGVVKAGLLNIHPFRVSYDPQGGLGLISGYVLDSRFSELGREGRLTKVLHETRNLPTGSTKGIGIDENTALVVTNVFTRPVGKVTKNEIKLTRGFELF
jgi:cyanophycinase